MPPSPHTSRTSRTPRRAIPRPGAPAIAAGALAIYAAFAAGSALALDRLPVLTQRVTDEAGALDARAEAAVERELTALQDAHGVRLYVMVVDSVGVEAPEGLAAATAEASGLGPTDALLVVAPDDGSDALWVGEAVAGVSADEIDEILARRVTPPLRQGDVEAAAVAGVDALGAAVGTTAADDAPAERRGPTPLLAALLFAGVAVLAARAVWVRRDG